MKNDMQIGRSYEFIDIPVNHYFFASGIIFQSRRSGDVMHSLSPDTLVVHVYSSVNNERY